MNRQDAKAAKIWLKKARQVPSLCFFLGGLASWRFARSGVEPTCSVRRSQIRLQEATNGQPFQAGGKESAAGRNL